MRASGGDSLVRPLASVEPGRRGERDPGDQRSGDRQRPRLPGQPRVERLTARDPRHGVKPTGMAQGKCGQRSSEERRRHRRNPAQDRLRPGLLPRTRSTSGQALPIHARPLRHHPTHERDAKHRHRGDLQPGDQRLASRELRPPIKRL